MSKSTPISQLPSPASVDINSISDVIEDDATVQEVLNQISMASNVMPPSSDIEIIQPEMPQYMPPATPPAQPQHQPQHHAQPQYAPPQHAGMFQAQASQAAAAPQPFYFQMPSQVTGSPSMDSVAQEVAGSAIPPVPPKPQGFLANLTAELRTILLVIIVTVAVQILPMEALLLRYAPLARIPYAPILAKGVAAGAIFFVVRRYLE